MKRTLLAALLLAAAPARAAFENLGAGARAPGLGGAFTALADDVYSIYYNPAGLAQLEQPQFSASYAKLFVGLSDGSDLNLSQIAYAHPFKYGKGGTLGIGWQRFGLSSLYSEQTLHCSYARELMARDSGSRLLAGVNVKYLSHSFGSTPEAANSCNGLNCTGNGADPVLTGKTSKSTPDADLGFIYRLPRRFQIGFMAEHLMRPNVGFSQADKLPLNLHAGVAYKTLWMSLTGELQANKAPDGSTDKDFILAAERYFPTLDYGQFGLRGSLGLGSRSWKQLTIGGSYRINKIQFDYGFLMPLGVFNAGSGTHRLALTLHFGAPNAEEEISREVLEKTRLLREGRIGDLYGMGNHDNNLTPPHDLDDPKLADVRRMIDDREFQKAQQRLAQLLQGAPANPSIDKLSQRLDAVAFFYPTLSAPAERWETALSSSAILFLHGRDRLAILHASYAAALNSSDLRLEKYLARLEKDTSIKAERLPADKPRGYIEEQLYRVEAAHNLGDNKRSLHILSDLLEVEPNHLTALERLGSAYFMMHKYPEAMEAWQRALPLESSPAEIAALRQYIQQARERTGGKEASLPGGLSQETAPAEPEPAPAPTPAPKPRRKAKASPQSQPVGDPRDVPQLYQKGVDHFARGEYPQATAMFMRILQIDPFNAQARKAIERIKRDSAP